MKYYAVTEDPRELYHYGVKGMKWGQHIFGDKPKSPGYKRAASKLRSFTKKAKESSRKHEERRYEKAVQKAQRRMAIVENLNAVDNDKTIYDQVNRAQKELNKRYKQNARINRANERRDLKYAKSEAKMDKYVQQARQGKLKYGRLSDEQVQRVQERLQLESNARRLGSAEKTWRQQKKEARRAGYLSGITKGTAAAMEEVARAGATWGAQHVLDRQKLRSAAKHEGKEERIKNRAKNKKTHKDIDREIKQEAYETLARSGEAGFISRRRPTTTKGAVKKLENIKDKKRLEDRFDKYLEDNGFANQKDAERAYANNHKDRASRQEFINANGAQRRQLLLNEAKEKKNDAERKAYDSYIQDAVRKQRENDAEQQYQVDLKRYNDQLSNDMAAINRYRNEVEKYNKDIAAGKKNVEVPRQPVLFNPKPPVRSIYNTSIISYDEWKRLRELGLSGNNQGGGKKK